MREIVARRINSSLCHNSHSKAAIQSERLLPFLILSNTVRGKETSVDGHQLEQIYLPIKTAVFWNRTPCSLVATKVSEEHATAGAKDCSGTLAGLLPAKLHDVTCQTETLIFTVITSDLSWGWITFCCDTKVPK